jgi:very-short-patch-repair endonuclease
MTIPFEKSFASTDKHIYLKDKNVDARTIAKYSNKKYEFICNICNHTLYIMITSVSNNIWCKYCNHQELCKNKECIQCFKKSFANSNNISKWSSNNNIEPRLIFNYTHTKYLFICILCHQEYECSPANINNNKSCPYCKNKKLCSNIECIICMKKSFASHERSEFWSDKNTVLPRNIFKQTNKKYIFNCNICKHELLISPNNIYHSRWCSKCKNKTEKQLFEVLKSQFNIIFHPQYVWCKNLKTKRYLPFDFECEEKIIIELDGLQHFKQVRNWKSPDQQQIIDKYKMECAIQNNKHIIRIFQEDVYYNKNNWKDQLFDMIIKLKDIDMPTIKYIGIDPSYFTQTL